MLKGVNPGFFEFPEHPFSGVNFSDNTTVDVNVNVNILDAAIYSSDEFRMFGFKIKRCTKTRSHDWTECPFAHRGEKARRRDPRKFNYAAIACPDFRNGDCQKGEACEFAHGVFEYWLHPARYRTRACTAGRFCQRKVCFFAHTPEQLRSDTKYRGYNAYEVPVGGSNGGGGGIGCGSSGGESAMSPGSSLAPMKSVKSGSSFEGESDFLRTLRGLKIGEGGGGVGRSFGWEISDPDMPHIDWISDLLE